MLFLCPPNHSLAQSDCVHLSELTNEDLVSTTPEFGLRQLIEQAFNHAGATPRILHEMVVDETDRAGLVRNGLGTTFMPASAAKRFPDLCALPVQPKIELQMHLAWARGEQLGPAAARLAELLLAASPEG